MSAKFSHRQVILMDDELERIKQEKLRRLLQPELQSSKYPIGKVVELNDSNFEEFAKQQGIVVVDCWAVWCAPCRSMAPVMDQLAKEWGNKGVHIGKLNVDHNPRTAMRYGISSIPNFLVFQNGKYLGNIVGAVGKAPFVKLFKKLLKENNDEGYV